MTTARRTFVLDTSVLLSSPRALFAFSEHHVVLPIVVVKELENKRHDPELGAAARAALRHLEALRTQGGDLAAGVPVTEEGGTLRIEVNHADRSKLPDAIRNDHSNDTRILTVAHALRDEGLDVTLVSQDLPLRILASAVCKVPAEEYRGDRIPDSGYTGLADLATAREAIDMLYRTHSVSSDELDPAGAVLPGLPVNTGLVLTGAGSSALARLTADRHVSLVPGDLEAFGIKGRSAEQRVALAHLLDPNIGIVSMGGPGGTGKSLLALAAGIEAVLEKGTHSQVVVFRPLYAVGGQTLGFLPGSEAEKMDPWAAAVHDALRAICGGNQDMLDEITDRNIVEIQPLTHIRGRTLTDSIVIVDEAQNLERNVLLTALSRTGENTRVILTHDVAQRDNLHVSRHDGVAAVVETLKGEALFAHTTLRKSERSPVAALVTRVLDTLDL